MIKIAQMNTLTIEKVEQGQLFLESDGNDTLSVPQSTWLANKNKGDSLEVFIYRDADNLLQASLDKPIAVAGQFALLRTVDVTRAGAFMDWGLKKDLFVPLREQHIPFKTGQSYVVYIYVDKVNERAVASSKLHKFLRETTDTLQLNQTVSLLIYAESDLGYKAIIDNLYSGLLYKNEIFTPVHYGQTLTGYVKTLRDDEKIDLSLQLPGHTTRDSLANNIISYLKSHEGSCSITDKSTPELIYKEFNVSKSNYKKALGKLYKDRRINIDKHQITLVD
jgi:predicted RNA-binding protein (virulence factor B family)